MTDATDKAGMLADKRGPADVWKLYCDSFRELFGNDEVELSPVALIEFAEKLLRPSPSYEAGVRRAAQVCKEVATGAAQVHLPSARQVMMTAQDLERGILALLDSGRGEGE